MSTATISTAALLRAADEIERLDRGNVVAGRIRHMVAAGTADEQLVWEAQTELEQLGSPRVGSIFGS